MSHTFDAIDLSRCEAALRVAIECGESDPSTNTSVRSMVGEQLAPMVMAAASLQAKARVKLGDGIWWCTQRSLSQATPHQVADLKARWTDESPIVIDLCCGIGADTFAIAKAKQHRKADQHSGPSIVAVDRDPLMAAMARENLRLNAGDTIAPVDVRCNDVTEIEIPRQATVHVDPDRRDDAGRKVRPQDYSPSWDVVSRIIDSCDAAIIKLAPAADLEDQSERHRIWISLSGSVREQTLLAGAAIERASRCFGGALKEAERTAVLVGGDGQATFYSGQAYGESGERSDKPLEYMVDPDPAIRAAGLTESFAGRYECQMIGGPSGFLTGDRDISPELAVCERVIWSGSCDDRKLRKTMRSMDCFPWRVKTRGVAQDPNLLEKRYRDCGEKPVTLWIGKTTRRQYAALTTTDVA